MTAEDVKDELQKYAGEERALQSMHFFKTGEGQYGEGDIFIGATVPETRLVAKQFKNLPLKEVQKLLDSEVHEHRLCGLLILVQKFSQGSREEVYALYIRCVYTGRINNWDLVDLSADRIMGQYLMYKPRDILFELAGSDKLWERRVAIMSSFAFIKKGDPLTTLQLAEILLHDSHDLIQKAVGWMLREIGKRCDRQILLNFLDKHAHEMPRTMLRYSLEHLPHDQRKHYMSQKTNR